MALRACPECRHQVSSSAESCPSCGFKLKKRGSGCSTALVVCTLLGLLLFIIIAAVNPDSPRGSASDPGAADRKSAWYAARELIRRGLLSPSTADFPNYLDPDPAHGVRRITDIPATFHVWGWVDSQNRFGAKIRTDWEGVLERNNSDNWQFTWKRVGTQTAGQKPQSL